MKLFVFKHSLYWDKELVLTKHVYFLFCMKNINYNNFLSIFCFNIATPILVLIENYNIFSIRIHRAFLFLNFQIASFNL